MEQSRDVILGGVLRPSGDLRAAVHATEGFPDVGRVRRHDPALPIRAARPRARATTRPASSILNVLWPKPAAPLKTAAAARRNASSVGGWPRRETSASATRHGLCATPPIASLASAIRPPSKSSAAATETSAKA